MITIFKTKKYKPIIFDDPLYADSISINLRDLFKGSLSLTVKELKERIIDLPDYKMIYFRNGTLHLYNGLLFLTENAHSSFTGVVLICKNEKDELVACVYNDNMPASIHTIFNKYIKKFGITRKNTIPITYKEFVKLFSWPIEMGLDDYDENVQKELSNAFINNEKQQLNG